MKDFPPFLGVLASSLLLPWQMRHGEFLNSTLTLSPTHGARGERMKSCMKKKGEPTIRGDVTSKRNKCSKNEGEIYLPEIRVERFQRKRQKGTKIMMRA